MPTVTESAVTPVWSLKALAGIDELPPEPPPVVVVVVDAELVELQAVAVAASSTARPTAATRNLSDARATFPPVAGPPGADDSPNCAHGLLGATTLLPLPSPGPGPCGSGRVPFRAPVRAPLHSPAEGWQSGLMRTPRKRVR